MTVQNTIVKNVYVGNGSTTVFPFTFECNKAEHIQAFVKDAAGNISSTTNFKVDLEQKNLTYPNTGEPLAKGDKLIILRQLPLQQLLNLLNQGPFYAEDIEETFDEIVMMLQQMTERIGRSLAVSIDIDAENSFNTIIPLEAGKTFRVKDDGTGFEVTEDPGKVIDGAKALLKQTTQQAEFAKEQADASSQSAVNAQNAAKEVKEIYGDGNFTPLSDLLGGLGTKLKRWGAIFANKVFASNLPIVYNSVAEMKADTMLWEGMNTKTLGYYEPNDGGGASYLIRVKSDSDTDDGGSLHELSNGLVAELVHNGQYINVGQYGLISGRYINDYWDSIIAQAIKLGAYIKFNEGIYYARKTAGANYAVAGIFVSMEGNGTTIICDDSFDDASDLFRFTSTNKQWHSFIRGLTFESVNEENVRFYLCYIFDENGESHKTHYKTTIHHNVFKKHHGYAIYSNGNFNGGFNNCDFSDNVVYGLFLQAQNFGDSNRIERNNLYGSQEKQLDNYVIFIEQISGSACLHVAGNNCISGLGYFKDCQDLTIENNQIENTTQSSDSIDYLIKCVSGANILIVGNSMSAHSLCGIVFCNALNTRVENCTFNRPKDGLYAFNNQEAHLAILANIRYTDENYTNITYIPGNKVNGWATNVFYETEAYKMIIDSALNMKLLPLTTSTFSISPIRLLNDDIDYYIAIPEIVDGNILRLRRSGLSSFYASGIPHQYTNLPIKSF